MVISQYEAFGRTWISCQSRNILVSSDYPFYYYVRYCTILLVFLNNIDSYLITPVSWYSLQTHMSNPYTPKSVQQQQSVCHIKMYLFYWDPAQDTNSLLTTLFSQSVYRQVIFRFHEATHTCHQCWSERSVTVMTSPRLNSNSPASCGVKSYSACTSIWNKMHIMIVQLFTGN